MQQVFEPTSHGIQVLALNNTWRKTLILRKLPIPPTFVNQHKKLLNVKSSQVFSQSILTKCSHETSPLLFDGPSLTLCPEDVLTRNCRVKPFARSHDQGCGSGKLSIASASTTGVSAEIITYMSKSQRKIRLLS